MTELGFASAVRAAVRQEQDRAGRSAFAAALMSDRPTVDTHVALLAQRYVVEDLLEQAAEVQRHDPIAGAFVALELHRASAIAADLAVLAGPGWRKEVSLIPATKAYVDRLREVAFTWPGGFVAHYVARHLDDSGHEEEWALLDAAPWDETERARIIDEIRRAVRLNAAVLENLAEAQAQHSVA
jgi:heme oxygenase (biliverdin-producing, ferredoxin)